MTQQKFYFSDGPYLQAMQGLYAALSESEALIKFIGQPRTGKSGVCEKLTQYLQRKDYRVIYFDYAIESPDMLRSLLSKKLEIADSFNMNRHLEDVLSDENDKPLILLFDDAHELNDITLVEIYRLASVQVAQRRMINIVLCGEPELQKRLSQNKNFAALLHHVTHNFLLQPMDAQTTTQFLSAFLEKLQLSEVQLEPAALNLFYKSCKGYPAPTLSLCQLVLSLRQHNEEQAAISKEELQNAIRGAASDEPVRSGQFREANRLMIAGPIVLVFIIASLALLFRQLSPVEPAAVSENLALIDSSRDLEAAVVTNSPFAAIAEEDSAVEASDSETIELAVEAVSSASLEPLPDRLTRIEEVPVSDSSLALVTAQERGISDADITVPDFEPLNSNLEDESGGAAAGDAVVSQLANISITRPMLVLEEEPDTVQLTQAAIAPVPEPEPISEPQTQVESAVSSEPEIEASLEEVSAASNSPIEYSALSPLESVQSWLNAWENHDLETYFDSYADEFEPRYHASKSDWLRNRQRVIGSATRISLELTDFVVVSEDDESIEVHFWLAYQSPTYRDDTRKKLILKKLEATESQAERFVILEEINLEVRV